jgi:PIN domain nuclease of toxin-antitoxin system
LDKIAVLDSSALMAVMRSETGAEIIAACLDWAIVSTVNLAEVETKLVSAGLDEQLAWRHIAEMECKSVPFDEEQARIAGGLVKVTRPFGLSLGDRACLALAMQRQATAYTTDRVWKSLDLGIEIKIIR